MACPLLLAVGFAILLVSEFTGVAALRIVAVAVLLTAAIGGGIRAGLATEPPALLEVIGARFTAKLARAITVVLLLPVALSLVLAVAGALLRPASPQFSGVWPALGAAVALVLLAVLAAALALVLRALRAGSGMSR